MSTADLLSLTPWIAVLLSVIIVALIATFGLLVIAGATLWVIRDVRMPQWRVRLNEELQQYQSILDDVTRTLGGGAGYRPRTPMGGEIRGYMDGADAEAREADRLREVLRELREGDPDAYDMAEVRAELQTARRQLGDRDTVIRDLHSQIEAITGSRYGRPSRRSPEYGMMVASETPDFGTEDLAPGPSRMSLLNEG